MATVFAINGDIETDEDIDEDTFTDMLMELIESKGWSFGGSILESDESDYDEESDTFETDEDMEENFYGDDDEDY